MYCVGRPDLEGGNEGDCLQATGQALWRHNVSYMQAQYGGMESEHS